MGLPGTSTSSDRPLAPAHGVRGVGYAFYDSFQVMPLGLPAALDV